MLDLLTQDDVYVRWYVSLHARSGLVDGWFVGKSEQVLFLLGWLLLAVRPKVREGKMNEVKVGKLGTEVVRKDKRQGRGEQELSAAIACGYVCACVLLSAGFEEVFAGQAWLLVCLSSLFAYWSAKH